MELPRKWLVGLALVATQFATNASAQDSEALVGFLLPTQEVVRYPYEFKWFEEELAKYGDKAIAGYANSNATTMTNIAQNMFQQGIKVLVLDPVDAKAGGILTRQAHDRGIKVITYDTDVTDGVPDWWVGRSGVQLGYQHINSAVAAKECGKFAYVRGDRAYTNYHLMSQAYDELAANNDDCIDIVYDADSQGWVTSAAMRNVEASLQKTPDLDAIVCMWDNCAQTAVQALKVAGKQPGDVYVTGTDASPQSLLLIAEGWQGMSSFTPIGDMAVAAAQLAHALAHDLETPTPTSVADDGKKLWELEPVLVTRDNLCDFAANIAPEGWGVSIEELADAGLTCN